MSDGGHVDAGGSVAAKIGAGLVRRSSLDIVFALSTRTVKKRVQVFKIVLYIVEFLPVCTYVNTVALISFSWKRAMMERSLFLSAVYWLSINMVSAV